MVCTLCNRSIRPGDTHYTALGVTVCPRCPFHRGDELHDLAAPDCPKAHSIWRHPRGIVLRRSTP